MFSDFQQPKNLPDQTQILALLYDIGRELTSILDLEDLMRTVGLRVKQLVDYDLFSIMLLNSSTNRLEHAVAVRFDERIQVKQTLALGQGLCGAAMQEREPIRVGEVASDPRYVRCEAGIGIQSELVVPLIARDRILGVLDLESMKPDAFHETHERMLSLLASTVAIAIENARLYDQLRRAEQSRRQDLERAREVQRLLLPETMPEVPGLEVAVLYVPAQELGGDFYDFLPYADGRLAIAVGDVAGKGPAAALLASLGVGILREHIVHQPSPPAELLADLNGHLQVAGGNGRFIAMTLGIYDPAKKELCMAGAGFPHPLLVRGGRAVPVPINGVPLGLLPDTQYEAQNLPLQHGDVVVFCSDGVHEQTNALEEEFGADRLISQLAELCESRSAGSIAEDIMQAINEHAGENGCGDCRDDRTIVVLRFTE
jgi:sigma-B regulation protein RsbU (phosphoserine phosphatase)